MIYIRVYHLLNMKKAKTPQNLTVKQIAKLAVPILKKNGVVKAGVFGSYARGEAKKKSDIDMLIQVKGRKFSLFDLVGLQQELEKILEKRLIC